MKKKGFTLIETVIVLVIISFLLGLTMYFGSKNIQKLNVLTFKQQFVERYQTLYMNSLNSSYLDGKKYEKIDIYIGSGLYYSTDGNKTDLLDFSDFYYTGMYIDGNPVKNLKISLSPYSLKCKLYFDKNGNIIEGSGAEFNISYKKGDNSRCFKISNYNCRLTEYICN